MTALYVSPAEMNALRLKGGVRGGVRIDRLFGLNIIPEARLGLAQELLDRNATVNALLAGRPILSESPCLGRGIFTAGAGVVVAASDSLAFYLDYDAELRDGSDSHTLSGGFRLSW